MSFNDVKKELLRLENPIPSSVISGITAAVPLVGSLMSEGVNLIFNDFQIKKRKEFLDIILSESDKITSDMVNDIEFIINFAKMLEVINRLSSNDKIKYFANLMKNGYFTNDKIINDEFEEYLDILNRLSYREINYLLFMKDQENKFSKLRKTRKNINYHISWNRFNRLFSEKFNTKGYYIYLKLKSTGFVEEELEVDTDIDGDEDSGYSLRSADISTGSFYTTEAFKRFSEIIVGEENE